MHTRTVVDSRLAVALIAMGFTLTLLPSAGICESLPQLSTLTDVHERYRQQITSAHATVEEVTELTPLFYQYFHRTPPPSPERGHSQSYWAFRGKKFYTRTEYPGTPGATLAAGGAREQELIYDGDRTSTIDHYANRPGEPCADARAERLGHTARHNPLEFGYWTAHGDWIADVLRQRRFTVRVATPHPVFGHLVQLDGEERGGEIQRFWMAPEKGMIAVKSQIENANTHQTDTYEAVRLESHNRLWIPIVGRRTLKDGAGRLVSQTEYTAHDFAMNDVQETQFAFKLPPGASFWDADTRIKYLVDAHGSLVKQIYSPQAPPGGFTARWIFMACTTILTVSLVTALVRWRRCGPSI